MNRTRRIVLIFPLVAALLGGAFFGLGRAGSSTVGCVDEQVVGVAGLYSALAEGRGIAAVSGDKIVVLDGFRGRSAYTPVNNEAGVLRHIANAPSAGTVFVKDKAGPDTVVAVTPRGVSEISSSGEASHPTMSTSGKVVWAEDFRELKMPVPGSPDLKTVARPQGSTAIFSPLFVDTDRLLAVVQEPVEDDIGEDDTLNNLYEYDMVANAWTQTTAFDATAEKWSVLRTPVLARDGSVYFVRVQGAASEARPPSYELWSLRADVSSKVRDLPGEMFLAGATDRGLLWNMYDGTEWRLFSEDSTGLRDLGCGAVMVDPRAQPDPDIPKEDSATRTSRRASSNEATTGLGSAEMAVLVGDFSSRQEAEAVALRLGLPGSEIVTHGLAPLAIAPGKWAVAKRLPADADLSLALDDFRRQFPAYADRSWIVSLLRGTSTG